MQLEMIFVIRGIKVMLDRDGISTKVSNQAVKRNLERFPSSFMFKLKKVTKIYNQSKNQS